MPTGLLSQSAFVIEQRKKFIETDTTYDIFDTEGCAIGTVRQVAQSAARKAFRLVSKMDEYLGHEFEVTDANGAVQMRLERPAKFLKSRLVVTEPDGAEIGEIAQLNNIGKVRFGLTSRGTPVGELRSKNIRDRTFDILDASEKRVGSISKRFEGLSGFVKTEDKYAVTIGDGTDGSLRRLALAGGIGVDLALFQSGQE